MTKYKIAMNKTIVRSTIKALNQMKRYRIIITDFDTRANILSIEIKKEWKTRIKESWIENKQKITAGLVSYFGELHSPMKINNFVELGDKPLSVIAFHNNFFEQIRIAFVMGAYYPALTGSCALGERILNHLLLIFREDYKKAPEYKKIYKKKQVDNWDLLIQVLSAWNVLLPNVATKFGELKQIRNKAIHFRPETDRNDRELALEAINTLRDIISGQFSGWGTHPWFFSIPGEIYIKKEWENKPFINKVYLPNCTLVGPYHVVESIVPNWVIKDDYKYDNKEITDEMFCTLRNKFNKGGQKVTSQKRN